MHKTDTSVHDEYRANCGKTWFGKVQVGSSILNLVKWLIQQASILWIQSWRDGEKTDTITKRNLKTIKSIKEMCIQKCTINLCISLPIFVKNVLSGIQTQDLRVSVCLNLTLALNHSATTAGSLQIYPVTKI